MKSSLPLKSCIDFTGAEVRLSCVVTCDEMTGGSILGGGFTC